MDFKNLLINARNIVLYKIIETIGIGIIILGLLFFLSLITYSPNDPNFIFSQNTEIKNLLGYQGSIISDLFFQSIGSVAYLVSITLIISGINTFRTKEFLLIIENIFFTILYSCLGTLFLTYFYSKSFIFYINGNGGFVGYYLNDTFLNNLIKINETLFYYFLIIFTLCLFFMNS